MFALLSLRPTSTLPPARTPWSRAAAGNGAVPRAGPSGGPELVLALRLPPDAAASLRLPAVCPSSGASQGSAWDQNRTPSGILRAASSVRHPSGAAPAGPRRPLPGRKHTRLLWRRCRRGPHPWGWVSGAGNYFVGKKDEPEGPIPRRNGVTQTWNWKAVFHVFILFFTNVQHVCDKRSPVSREAPARVDGARGCVAF